MKDSIDDALNAILGPRNNYTEEEINKAQERKKKCGGTLLDNLREVTGRGLSPSVDMDSFSFDSLVNSQTLNTDLDSFQSELETYKKNNEKKAEENPHETLTGSKALDAFKDVEESLSKKVFGQEEFIKKLTVAFKRPLVLPPKGEECKNVIFITGREDTGRHLALNTLVKELSDKKVLSNSEIYTMNLKLYPNATDEKIFLQDLYSAVSSKADVIVFEGFEDCHSSFLSRLSDLAVKGRCELSERYVNQNGQLINVPNTLSSKTVSSLNALGKYLIFISTNSVDSLADSFGAKLIDRLGDICMTKELSEEALTEIANVKLDDLKKVSLSNLGFKLSVSDDFLKTVVSRAEGRKGLTGMLEFISSLSKALAELKLCNDYKVGTEVFLFTGEDGRVRVRIDGEEKEIDSLLPKKYSGNLDAVKADLDKIVGLKEIKEYIYSLEGFLNIQKKREASGLKSKDVSKHMIFTGNPGTGKTTIARIISRYLKAIGVLSGGQLVEVSRADLVGQYVGHTAPLTKRVLESAIGGVLFIDEAYSLYRGKDDSFGLEAIDTLVKGIEDNRDNLVVILAGYSKEMEEFLEANSGLKSRFPNVINFPDYTGEELLQIAVITASGRGYEISAEAKDGLLNYFNRVQSKNAKDSGNGRLVRNKVEDAIINQATRLTKEPSGNLSELVLSDFELNDV